MAFDTFDTDAVATAGVTFTNGNLTAQGGAGVSLTSPSIAQVLEGKKSGKWYVEFTCVAVSGNVDGAGIVSSWGVSNTFIGNTNGGTTPDIGWGYYTNSHVVHNGSTQTQVNAATYGAGDVIGVAIDLDNQKIWFRLNTGAWQGTSGTPDPATNTSGFDISTAMSGGARIYPAVNLSGNATKYTINCGASSFTGSVPSGFTSGWTNTTAGTYFGTFAAFGNGGSGINAPASGNKAVSKYTATLTGSVTSIVVPFASKGGNVKGVIYASDGTAGAAGTLLGVSTNADSSANHEITFNFSGVSVVSGTVYWFGVVADNLCVVLGPALSGGMLQNTGTYASPTTPFGSSTAGTSFRIPVIINVLTNNIYNVTMAEAGALADTVSARGTFGATLSEAGTLSDSESTANTSAASVAEAANAVETITSPGVYGVAVAEVAALVDHPTTASTFNTTVAESVTLDESYFQWEPPTPSQRIVYVAAEDRIVYVAEENRVVVVSASGCSA